MDILRMEHRCVICGDVLSESNSTTQCRRHLTAPRGGCLTLEIPNEFEVSEAGVFDAVVLQAESREKKIQQENRAREVLELVARVYGVAAKDISSHSLNSSILRPRRVLVYLLKDDLHMPFEAIGELLKKDRTTVAHAYSKVTREITADPVIADEVERFKKALATMLQ
jgi:hypothetical protein